MLRSLLLAVFVLPALALAQATPAVEATPAPVATPTPSPVAKPTRPYPAIEHVLIISVDGLRPDRALLVNMPNLRFLVRNGSYTFWAKTTPNSITLPSHTSMLTGVSPRKHGIEWNADLPLIRPIYPRVPTIFEMATRAGLTSALIAGKSKFNALTKPGTVTYPAVPRDEKSNDTSVANAALALLAEQQPDLIFVHFPDVDSAGHGYGWGSAQQVAAMEAVDVELGRLLDGLRERGMAGNTFLILTADHGGAGRSHGPDDPRSRHIPWIAVGPGVVAGQDLTQFDELEVRTEDSAATACYLLGLELPEYFDGKPVLRAFGRKN